MPVLGIRFSTSNKKKKKKCTQRVTFDNNLMPCTCMCRGLDCSLQYLKQTDKKSTQRVTWDINLETLHMCAYYY